MPAKSEKQRRFFAMCATHGNRHMKKNCPDMPKSKMREFMTLGNAQKGGPGKREHF